MKHIRHMLQNMNKKLRRVLRKHNKHDNYYTA